jgi:carotenoid 1,2-hydratase
MTERGARHVAREPQRLAVGPSRLVWQGDTLVAEIDEITAPIPRRLRGRIVLRPDATHDTVFNLDAGLRHRWHPWAPSAHVEVTFEQPRIAWSGRGYADANWGTVPLARDFRRWDWSRAHAGERTLILYHAAARDGGTASLALAADASGISAIPSPPRHALPRGLWRLARETGSETKPSVAHTLEDTPFYARGLVRGRIDGHDTLAVHETLDLDRFRAPIVQAMLPFRMPRRR